MRKSLCLLPLALGTLGLGLTEYVMMGILPDIAHSMHCSIPKAGNFISFYALGVVFGAIMLVIVARTKPLKTILLWLMTIFTVANFLTAFVTNYYIYDKIKLPDKELIEKIFNNRKKLAGYRTIRMDFL